MLLSPPFLPARAELDEAAWLDLAMAPADNGAFPVSHDFAWHGGRHLVAPLAESGTGLPVRAIADGTIVYVRPRTEADSPDEPLNYGAGYTSDAVVVVKHTTDIGANAQGQPVTVTFYSVYMHLHSIRARVMLNRPIYRKDEIGQAGHIYGEPNRIHFEICCDDANLALLMGRGAGSLSTASDGRTDVLFGELYFALPPGTVVYGQKPLPNSPIATIQPHTPPRLPGQPASPTPSLQPLQPAYTTTEALFVGLRYAAGAGAIAQRGDALVRTYRADGGCEGDPLRESQSEYNLYSTSNQVSNAYPTNARPTPAAVYELLRFGRAIGPDALTPTDVPHWRRINYPGGTGWVNLNGANVRKFSDADFPPWRGWTLVADDNTPDSHCNSPTIADIVYGRDATRIQRSRRNASARLSDRAVSDRLVRTVCKFPSEWDASTIDARWNWLKTATDENAQPLSDEDYAKLRAHIAALCFPLPELFSAQWCFEPRQFIELFRTCGWMSSRELTQMLPRRHGSSAQRLSEIPWATAHARLQVYVNDLNRAARKYGLDSVVRRTHFLAQTYIETAMWRTMEEIGRAHQQRRKDGTMYWPAPAMEYYQAFYGRGAMQLTWAGNYEAYGQYRGLSAEPAGHAYGDPRITQTSTHFWADPRDRSGRVVQQARTWWPRFDPQRISDNPFEACDSAAHYWISKNTGGGELNINRVADQGITTNAVGRVSVLVNGGGYGFSERQAYAPFIERFLGDNTEIEPTRSFVVAYRNRNYDVYVDFTAQRPR